MRKNTNIPRGRSRKAGKSGRNRRPNNNARKNNTRRKIRAPVAEGSSLRQRKPTISNSANGGFRIQHQEPLGVINGSVNYVATQYNLNPGLNTTFPWLSQVAQNFELYRFRKLHVDYLSSSPSSVAGAICIAPDYNSSDSTPANFQKLEQLNDAYRDLVWNDGSCIVNPPSMGAMGPDRYIRTGSLGSNLDIKTYDVATINVGTTGQANTNQIGELWLSYDVDLFVPTSANSNINSYGQIVNANGAGMATTNILGTAGVSSGPIVITHVLNVVTITGANVGATYSLTYVGNAATFTTAVTGTAVGGTLTTDLTVVDAAGQDAIAFFTLVPTANTVTVTLAGPTVITTPGLGALYMAYAPGYLL